jgi:hypothetical protein
MYETKPYGTGYVCLSVCLGAQFVSRKTRWILIKFGVVIMPLDAILTTYFSLTYICNTNMIYEETFLVRTTSEVLRFKSNIYVCVIEKFAYVFNFFSCVNKRHGFSNTYRNVHTSDSIHIIKETLSANY